MAVDPWWIVMALVAVGLASWVALMLRMLEQGRREP